MDFFDIMKSSQIACCLEVSAYKPGNVHRNKNYDDLKYHHFLTSGVGFGDVVYNASKDNGNIGKYIKLGVLNSKKWSPSNANLGIIMLHIPIAQSAGKLIQNNENNCITISNLKREIKNTIKNTTVNDSLNLYDAIELANPNITPPKEGPDAQKDGKKELIDKNLTLYDVFNISKTWDNISKEWAEGFNISFEGYELLNKYYNIYKDINYAITITFIHLLSMYPDTLIARKNNMETAKIVSNKAKDLLDNILEDEVNKYNNINKNNINNKYNDNNDINNISNYKLLVEFENYLTSNGNNLNPGTTADIIASSIMIYLLDRINNNNTILW